MCRPQIQEEAVVELADMLERDYTVYRFWEGPPADVAASIRAIVVQGATPIERSLTDTLPNLGLVAYFSAGYESFDVEWARARPRPAGWSIGCSLITPA